jgi:hypothetical protein
MQYISALAALILGAASEDGQKLCRQEIRVRRGGPVLHLTHASVERTPPSHRGWRAE